MRSKRSFDPPIMGLSQKKNFATEAQRTQRKREEMRFSFAKMDQIFLISVSLCLCGALFRQPHFIIDG